MSIGSLTDLGSSFCSVIYLFFFCWKMLGKSFTVPGPSYLTHKDGSDKSTTVEFL